MHQQNLDRLRDYLRSHGRQAALLSNPATLTWLTGYAPFIESGPTPFEGGPALGWFAEGDLTLIVSDAEAGDARATGANVRDYTAYTVDEPINSTERQVAVLRDVLKGKGGFTGSVAVEMNTLTVPLFAAIRELLPGVTLQPADAQLGVLRAIKTADELVKIRAALKLCDLAQADLCQMLRRGITELELWGQMKARLEVAAGTRLPILSDLVAGARTAEIGGLPSTYTLKAGDAVIFDVVPRLNGYWGDNAATYFVGEQPPELAKAYAVVRDALRRGIDMVRPGMRARDIDQSLREFIRKAGYEPYPHHSGHGFGTTYHEEPRIVPYNDMRLEVGMVIALEPGIYLPDLGGVRLEHALLVTAEGCEVLTHHLE
jgi:Xaa-Pro aminopeptidase